jgi:uncharacterized protein Usg
MDVAIDRMEVSEMESVAFRRQIQGYGLTTANILYRLPDYPAVLQTYIWQDYDLAPRFPELNRFLEFWKKQIEGALFSVTVSHCGLIKPAELRTVDGEFRVH